jgi:cell envelope opacity-associated protein A
MSKSKAKSKPKKAAAPKQKTAKPAKPKKAETKQQIVIDLLKRPDGTTVAEIMKATGWLKHTVRGCFAGALKKKHGYEIVSEKTGDADRVYKIITK